MPRNKKDEDADNPSLEMKEVSQPEDTNFVDRVTEVPIPNIPQKRKSNPKGTLTARELLESSEHPVHIIVGAFAHIGKYNELKEEFIKINEKRESELKKLLTLKELDKAVEDFKNAPSE